MSKVEVGSLVRLLIVNGYIVTDARRHPTHIEVDVERMDVFGLPSLYTVALTDSDAFTELQRASIERSSDAKRKTVFIAASASNGALCWPEFVELLGGAVPSWRALAATYRADLEVLGQNQLPAGIQGEAWFLFEVGVADGLGFIFGQQPRHLGGRRRAARVADVLCSTPDDMVVLVDAKASDTPFSVTMAVLRPLIEYCARQKVRQQGHFPVGACLLVANQFEQDPTRLAQTCQDFLAETGIPLGCLTTSILAGMVERIAQLPAVRNAISWKHVLRRCGAVDVKLFDKELGAAVDQRIGKG